MAVFLTAAALLCAGRPAGQLPPTAREVPTAGSSCCCPMSRWQAIGLVAAPLLVTLLPQELSPAAHPLPATRCLPQGLTRQCGPQSSQSSTHVLIHSVTPLAGGVTLRPCHTATP